MDGERSDEDYVVELEAVVNSGESGGGASQVSQIQKTMMQFFILASKIAKLVQEQTTTVVEKLVPAAAAKVSDNFTTATSTHPATPSTSGYWVVLLCFRSACGEQLQSGDGNVRYFRPG